MEMSVCHCSLRSRHVQLKRTQAHGMFEALDGLVRLTKPQFDPGALTPCKRKVRVEHERTVDQIDAAIEIADHVGQHRPSYRESEGVFGAQLHCPLSQSCGFSDLTRGFYHPPTCLAP